MTTHTPARRYALLLNLALLGGVTLGTLAVAEFAVRHFATVRSVGPAVTVYSPIYGTRLRSNFSGVQITPEFTMHISTNSLGFRGPEPTSPPHGVLLYLGDSFTVGYGVDDGQEFPALVAARLARAGAEGVEYINAGRGNSGQGHWLKFLRREAPGFAPRLVILEVHETDFADNIHERLFDFDSAGSLVELPVARPAMGRLVEPILHHIPFVENSYLLGLLRQAYFAMSTQPRRQSAPARAAAGREPAAGATNASRIERENRLLVALLQATLDECRKNGWPVVAIRVELSAERDELVRSVLDANGARSARIPGETERPELYFPVDGHWNVAGQAFAADVVFDLVKAADPGIPSYPEDHSTQPVDSPAAWGPRSRSTASGR